MLPSNAECHIGVVGFLAHADVVLLLSSWGGGTGGIGGGGAMAVSRSPWRGEEAASGCGTKHGS